MHRICWRGIITPLWVARKSNFNSLLLPRKAMSSVAQGKEQHEHKRQKQEPLPPRFLDIFGIPHKMYRAQLLKASAKYATYDFRHADLAALEALEKEFGGIVFGLEKHAQAEDVSVIDALSKHAKPGDERSLVDRWQRDHVVLEEELLHVKDYFTQLVEVHKAGGSHAKEEQATLGRRINRAWNGYIGKYFLHMQAEEDEWMPFVARYFSEEEISLMDGKGLRSFPDAAKLVKLPEVFSWLDPDDQALYLVHVRKYIDDDALFKQVVANIKQAIKPEYWELLTKALPELTAKL